MPSTPDTLPAGGILITTRAYVEVQGDEIITLPTPDSSISGDTHYMVHELLRAVEQRITAHRNWIAKQGGRHPLMNRSARAKVRSRWAWAPERKEHRAGYFDYVATALEDLDLLRHQIRHHPQRKDEIISGHIKATYYKVYSRRKEHGLPTSPPRGWTREVRAALAQRL